MLLYQRLAQRKSAFVQPPSWSPNAAFPSSSSLMIDRERIGADFSGYVADAYKSNGVVFSVMLARMALFTEARFAWRQFRKGQPRSLFTTAELALLERPWPGGTTPLTEEEKQVAWIAFQPELINYFLTDQKMNDSARAVLHYVKPGSLKSRSRDE